MPNAPIYARRTFLTTSFSVGALLATDLRLMTARASVRRSDAAAPLGASGLFPWTKAMRDAVARNRFDPPMASWIYAMVTTALERAFMTRDPESPLSTQETSSRISGVCKAFLINMFPLETARFEALAGTPEPVAFELGERTMKALIEERKGDGSTDFSLGEPPVDQPGCWQSLQRPPEPPLRPLWGQVRPWILASGRQFRPEPPPPFGGEAFLRAVEKVRVTCDQRSEDDLLVVYKWADGDGTHTPPGHWNTVAERLIQSSGMDLGGALALLALLNKALMDAGIAAWDAKYAHWLLRPTGADPRIVTASFLRVPNFPAYVSAHSCFSGAAATLLAQAFPGEVEALEVMAAEASWSRVLAGFHYEFDCTVGLDMGKKIGRLAVEKGIGGSMASVAPI